MAGRSSLPGSPSSWSCLYNIGSKDSRDDEESRMADAVCEVRLRNMVCVKRESKPHALTNWQSWLGGWGSRVAPPLLLGLGAGAKEAVSAGKLYH